MLHETVSTIPYVKKNFMVRYFTDVHTQIGIMIIYNVWNTDLIAGETVNKVVKLLKDGVNYNKFFIDAMFSGTTEEAIVIGVPKGRTFQDIKIRLLLLGDYRKHLFCVV